MGERTLTQNVRDMTWKSNEMYNIKYCASGSSFRTPIQRVDPDLPQLESSFEKPSRYQPYLSRDSSTSGKLPSHGPRRVIKPYALFHHNFETTKAKISVSNSELKNYKALCSLASSQYNKYSFFLYHTNHFFYSCHPFFINKFMFFSALVRMLCILEKFVALSSLLGSL